MHKDKGRISLMENEKTIDHVPPPDIALALSAVKSLDNLCDLGPSPLLAQCLERLGCSWIGGHDFAKKTRITSLHLGNEFCERLLPTAKDVISAQATADKLAVTFTLVTPMLTDGGFRLLDKILPKLAHGTEVVVNDWGTLQKLRGDFPRLIPVLGRMLNKIIKDPRLPSAQWTKLQPFDGQSAYFKLFLARFSIGQLEMDVPPFAKIEQFNSDPMKLSVHLPYGYTWKGRMCRMGSLSQKDDHKFIAAHTCRKECLTYWVQTKRPKRNGSNDLYSFQRGNTQFYEHSDEMAAVIWQAVKAGLVTKLIYAGDWHENHSPLK